MKKAAPERVAWQCPECGRKYRIPRTVSRPTRCIQCTEATAAPAAEQPDGEPVYFEEARPAGGKELPTDVEAYIARKERERILDYLSNISRSMTFFRRLVWAMILVMVLNVLLMGAGLIYSFRTLGSLGGLLEPQNDQAGQPGRVGRMNDDAGPGAAQVEAIQDYSDTLNELLQEIRNQ